MRDKPDGATHFSIRLILIPVITGVAGAAIVALFMFCLTYLIDAVPRLAPRFSPVTPVIGALLVGSLILRFFPGAGGEGTPAYLATVNRGDGRLNLRHTLLKFPATVLTLGLYCSGGIVGPLLRMAAGAGGSMVGWILHRRSTLDRDHIHTAAICGVSGAISAIFHSPLGGGIFAAEVLRRDSMKYSDLIPSILTGGVAFVTSGYLLGQQPVFSVDAPAAAMKGSAVVWLIPATVLAGAVGMFFIFFFENTAKVMRRINAGQPGKALIGGAFCAVIWLLGAEWALNVSMKLYDHITSGTLTELISSPVLQRHTSAVLVIAILAKVCTTSLTVGSGLSGGFTGPLVILGAASGALVSQIAGFHPPSPEYYGLLACGTAAILSAAMNIPVAAIIITADVFGIGFTLPAVIGGIVAFSIYKRKTIYGYLVAPYMEKADGSHIL
jgi:CIC family chloride channel protein